MRELIANVENFEPQVSSETKEIKEELETTSTQQDMKQLDKLEVIKKVPSTGMHKTLSVTEAETNMPDEQVKPSLTKIPEHEDTCKLSAQAQRRSSLPTNTAASKGLIIDLTKNVMFDHSGATTFNSVMKHLPERLLSCDGSWNYLDNDLDRTDHKSLGLQTIITTNLELSPFLHLKETDILQDAEQCSEEEQVTDPGKKDNTSKNDLSDKSSSYVKLDVHTSRHKDTKEPLVSKDICEKEKEVSDEPQKLDLAGRLKESLKRLSTCPNEHHHTIDSFYQDDVDTWGSQLGGLDQVEPWEDLCSTKQWVTSPLHSPKLEDHLPCLTIHSQVHDNPKVDDLPNSKKAEAKEPAVLNDITSSQTEAAVTAAWELGNSDLPTGNKNAGTDVACFAQITEHFDSDNLKWMGDKDDSKLEIPQVKILKTFTDPGDTTRLQNMSKAKLKLSSPSQRFHRQTSHESCIVERCHKNIKPKLRPCSLNLDLGHQGVRDISNSQYLKSAKHSNAQEWLTPEAKHGSSSLELELFLSGSKGPVRRNSAPVSVSSVRTAFLIKTCKAKAVPVIPPKIQYSHIPHVLPEGSTDQVSKSTSEKKPAKSKLGKAGSALPIQKVKDHREDVPSSEPPSAVQRQIPMSNAMNFKPTSIPDLPVLRRKRSANGDTFMDRPRPERSSLLQRSSFRNRPRPQSLILFSPPFPIMDYPPVGDDGKLVLSPIKAEASPFDVFSNELAENLKTIEGVTLRNKMTLPKSGQRLETSTSCFYQPQRRSMIFDNRQIE